MCYEDDVTPDKVMGVINKLDNPEYTVDDATLSLIKSLYGIYRGKPTISVMINTYCIASGDPIGIEFSIGREYDECNCFEATLEGKSFKVQYKPYSPKDALNITSAQKASISKNLSKMVNAIHRNNPYFNSRRFLLECDSDSAILDMLDDYGDEEATFALPKTTDWITHFR
jgi:hypothetical protein